MSAEGAILKARAQLLMDEPFFGTLAIKLQLVADPSVKTAATNGTHLIYSPDYVLKLEPAKLKGLIAHEVMHCVLNHHTRRGERDPTLWNIAADIAENNHLIECGFVLPDGALIDKSYGDVPAETIYNKLDKENPPKPCPWGMVIDHGKGTNSINEQSTAAAESDWQVAVTQAAQMAKQQGKLPGNIEQFISEIINPKVDWRTVVWPFCTSIVQNDYTWAKPNRAYISEDEYLPSMRNQGAGHFVVITDTSASVSDEELNQFFTEIAAIHREVQPELVTIIQCDTEVQDVKQVEADDEFVPNEHKAHGRGGTRFSPAFKYISENCHDVEAAIYLTDLGSDDFGEAPDYPVLWVSTTSLNKVPFGSVIQM